jgi:hypothetical protein
MQMNALLNRKSAIRKQKRLINRDYVHPRLRNVRLNASRSLNYVTPVSKCEIIVRDFLASSKKYMLLSMSNHIVDDAYATYVQAIKNTQLTKALRVDIVTEVRRHKHFKFVALTRREC